MSFFLPILCTEAINVHVSQKGLAMCMVSSSANICHLKTHLSRTIFARPLVDPVASYPVCWNVGQGNCCTKSASWCALNNIIACTDVILAKDRYRRFSENVTKITSNVPLQVSIRQQLVSQCKCVFPSSGKWTWKSDKLDPYRIGMAPNMGLTWTTNNRFATCSRRSLESRQGQHKTDWYARVYIKDAQVVANSKSVFESGIEKGETCALPSWDTCLTKLKHVSHLSDQAEKGDRDTGNMAIKDIWVRFLTSVQMGIKLTEK